MFRYVLCFIVLGPFLGAFCQAGDPPAKRLRVVAFGAHPDDPESGAGGLIATRARQGHEVICACGATFRGGRQFPGRPEAEVRQAEKAAPGQGDKRMSGSRSEWLQVEGVKVHCLVAGPETGQPVLLLHGARFSSANWDEIGTIALLAGAGYRVTAVDLPGYGKSPANAAQPLTWMLKLIDRPGLAHPVVVSPSMSGRYALELASEEPKRIAGLVALAPVGIGQHRDHLARITAPVLAIWGENDTVVPVAQADLLVSSVRSGRKVILAGESHAAYMSNPARFHEELLRFLKELRTR